MTRSLWGGSAAVALLSCSLFFYGSTAIAEPLADVQEPSTQQKANNPGGAELSSTSPADLEATASIDNSTRPRTAIFSAPDAREYLVSLNQTPSKAPAAPAQPFVATAYSLRGRTASGKSVTRGIIAADRKLLPLGTRVRLDAGHYSGEYLVADTGGAVKGRKIDIWVPNTGEAMRFGRKTVKLTVLTRTRKPVPATAKRR